MRGSGPHRRWRRMPPPRGGSSRSPRGRSWSAGRRPTRSCPPVAAAGRGGRRSRRRPDVPGPVERPLRGPRRARRQQQIGGVARSDGGGSRVGRAVVEGRARLRGRQHARPPDGVQAVHHHGRRPQSPGGVVEACGRQSGARERADGADPRRAEEDGDPLRGVRKHEKDEVPLPDPVPGEPPAGRADPPPQLGVGPFPPGPAESRALPAAPVERPVDQQRREVVTPGRRRGRRPSHRRRAAARTGTAEGGSPRASAPSRRGRSPRHRGGPPPMPRARPR